MTDSCDRKGLLVVSFGTSHAATRPRTLEAVEGALESAFSDREFFRAWSSAMLRRKLEKEEGLHVDSVEEALDRMASQGIWDVIVQPTHLLTGEEYTKAQRAAAAFRDRFGSLRMGMPLISDEGDVEKLARILEQNYPAKRGEAVALMGHGSAGMAFSAYDMLAEQFRADGRDDILMGTVEFEPGIAPVLQGIRERGPERVHLVPLLVVAGDHVLNDMAGDGPDSWKNLVEAEGAQAVCHLNGLGESEGIHEMYIEHARNAAQLAAEVEQ